MENEDIEELEKKYKELGEKIEKLKNKKKCKRWRGKKGDVYYCVDNWGYISKNIDHRSIVSDYNYKTRNYFKTEEEAKQHFDNITTYYELMDLAEELNNGEEVDWNSTDQSKYYLCYSFYDKSNCYNLEE